MLSFLDMLLDFVSCAREKPEWWASVFAEHDATLELEVRVKDRIKNIDFIDAVCLGGQIMKKKRCPSIVYEESLTGNFRSGKSSRTNLINCIIFC